MIARFARGATMDFSAAIRHCVALFAFAVAVAVLVGASALAGVNPAYDVAAKPADSQPDTIQANTKSDAKTPCKRPKARAHYGCDTCQHHAGLTAVSRTRLFHPSPRLKLVVADALGDSLALAAAQASARLVLASGDALHDRRESGAVIARTARIRN